jgi:hypothetical protein
LMIINYNNTTVSCFVVLYIFDIAYCIYLEYVCEMFLRTLPKVWIILWRIRRPSLDNGLWKTVARQRPCKQCLKAGMLKSIA